MCNATLRPWWPSWRCSSCSTYGRRVPMALHRFIPIFPSAFHLKSTLISLPFFWLPNRKSQSLCPRFSMKVTHWLASTIILFPNRALPISRYFDPIATADNERCSILVKLLSVDWFMAEMNICIAVFLPNGVTNDIISANRFLI